MIKTLLLTTLALIAFAANSVLCRLALGKDLIDAGTFTAVRLLSGVLVLTLLVYLQHKPSENTLNGNWTSSVMLFVYAAAFSYAYISLDTGTGALILFGAVQITMILWTIVSGKRLQLLEWVGLGLALAGFIYLMLPSANTPSLFGFALMVVSGVAWGIYTIQGQHSNSPMRDTANNFIRTIPFVIILFLVSLPTGDYRYEGVLYAVLSGSLASGVGYTMWYMVLRDLQTMQAAVLQLLVPVIAALGGVIFVSEPLTQRLIFSALMILGGILMVIKAKYGKKKYGP